jgi:hypothetical protein
VTWSYLKALFWADLREEMGLCGRALSHTAPVHSGDLGDGSGWIIPNPVALTGGWVWNIRVLPASGQLPFSFQI